MGATIDSIYQGLTSFLNSIEGSRVQIWHWTSIYMKLSLTMATSNQRTTNNSYSDCCTVESLDTQVFAPMVMAKVKSEQYLTLTFIFIIY
jgi:accessory gene regulator protein AgrB